MIKEDRPIAKLVPIKQKLKRSPFGALKGSIIIQGDIVAPTGAKWNAEKGKF